MNKSLKQVFYKQWHSHFHLASRRGLRPLTLEEYIQLATKAGITSDQIGRCKGQYQLCRYTDEGDYTLTSCRFGTHKTNSDDRKRNGITADIMFKREQTRIRTKKICAS